MKDEIKVIELLNGEKLLGVVKPPYASDQNFISIRNPVAVAPQKQEENGDVKFALMLWPLFKPEDTNTFKINESAVVTSYVPSDKIVEHYIQVMEKRDSLPPRILPNIQS